jgi:AraC-like DNA-binding protein
VANFAIDFHRRGAVGIDHPRDADDRRVWGDAAQLDIIMRTLNKRLARARQVSAVAQRLTSLSTQSREPLTTRALAAHAGLSARRVQSIFRDDVGLSPKQLLRISRLQRALALRRGNDTLSWSSIAGRATMTMRSLLTTATTSPAPHHRNCSASTLD